MVSVAGTDPGLQVVIAPEWVNHLFSLVCNLLWASAGFAWLATEAGTESRLQVVTAPENLVSHRPQLALADLALVDQSFRRGRRCNTSPVCRGPNRWINLAGIPAVRIPSTGWRRGQIADRAGHRLGCPIDWDGVGCGSASRNGQRTPRCSTGWRRRRGGLRWTYEMAPPHPASSDIP